MEAVTQQALKAAEYLHQLFARTRNGRLTLLGRRGQYGKTFCLDWDEASLEALIEDLATLRRQLASAALNGTPKEVYETYLRPFPASGLDEHALEAIWIKQDLAEPLTDEEQALAQSYAQWYGRQALTRLPFLRTEPAGLINRARRYAHLVRLGAPDAITEQEARNLGWELVKYRFWVKEPPKP